MKNQKQANINITIKNLFLTWLKIINSFHNLTPQQREVLALLLYYHYKIGEEITNDKIVWKLVFDYDTKKLIREELNIEDQSLQNVLSKLRKRNIIDNDRVTKNFIPNIEKKATNFKLIFNFNLIHE